MRAQRLLRCSNFVVVMYRVEYFAGVDEVGRGPLAGAVLAAAVILDPVVSIKGLRDSKQLSEKTRRELDKEIRGSALDFCVGRAEVDEIDEVNILNATMLAMQRAVLGLKLPVEISLVDGNRVPDLSCLTEYLVRGDSKSDAIKAASIVAKVARDDEMIRMDHKYPGYAFAQNKGYPTAAHLQALRRLGPSPIHRLSFAPCRQAELLLR